MRQNDGAGSGYARLADLIPARQLRHPRLADGETVMKRKSPPPAVCCVLCCAACAVLCATRHAALCGHPPLSSAGVSIEMERERQQKWQDSRRRLRPAVSVAALMSSFDGSTSNGPVLSCG